MGSFWIFHTERVFQRAFARGVFLLPIVTEDFSVLPYSPGEAAQDLEGMLVMRTLAKNMSFLMKSIALGKEKYGLPEKEQGVYTNFIR